MIVYFNPTCEMVVRQDGMNYMPPKTLAKMEMDLAPLMAFLTSKGDKIVGQKPDDVVLEVLDRQKKGTMFVSVEDAKNGGVGRRV